MKYTYEELQIMLDETEKAFDVMKKFAEVNNEFLMREDVKPLYEKFLLDKLNKQLAQLTYRLHGEMPYRKYAILWFDNETLEIFISYQEATP